MLENRLKKIVQYYDTSKRENVEQFTKPLLFTLLLETDAEEAKEIEESISDIIDMKLATQNLLSLKLRFHTPTPDQSAGDYILGEVLKGDRRVCPFGLSDEELSRNVLIAGRIGTGKTTTNLRILYEWGKIKKPALISDFKNDYFSLLPLFREMYGPDLSDYFWVFLLGEDQFKFNPLRIPFHDGKLMIDPLAYIETFTDIFIHSYGLREPSASILVTCLRKLYEEAGIFDGQVNRFPTLSELKEEVSNYSVLSNFDRESKRSIFTRLRLLTEGVLGKVFETRAGVKFEDILEHFVVLGLGSVPLIENKKFFIEVFLGLMYEYAKKIDDRTKTKHLTVIEEAHNLLPKEKSSLVSDVLTKLEIALMELRDFGYGIMVIDQKPADLSPDAIAVTGTKVIHALDREEDKKTVANAIGLTDEQKKHLSYLGRGEVFIKLDRDSFPYPFHAQIEPIIFTGEVKKNAIREYMQSFFETYPIDQETVEESEEVPITGLNPNSSLPERKPPEIHPEQILKKSNWFNSLKDKIQSLPGESGNIILLLGEGLACKSSDFKKEMKMTGRDFKQHAVMLAKKGLIGFKRMKAAGNPIFYFLRPEGLAAFHILTGKWPYDIRGKKLERKHSHSEMKEHVIERFRRVGWEIVQNKVESGYVDICLKKDDLIKPVEISTGSNKYDQVYKNILKCVEAFGGVYFVCENEVAYNIVLQQASKLSFDYNVNFHLCITIYENFLEGKKFEKYEF